MIQYKWDTYGHKHHLIGCILQFFSTLIIIIYISLSYLREPDEQESATIPILLAIAVAYPALYESFQLYNAGWRDYFSDLQNYVDISNIVLSMINIYQQLAAGFYQIECRIIMCIMILMITVKTFFFLRMFSELTFIVVML